MEIAHVDLEGTALRARGTQIGLAYELRYELAADVLTCEIVGGPRLERRLEGEDFFDLGFSPLFNSLPVLRHGLHGGGAAREFTMAWVAVPGLTVSDSAQRYEPLGPGVVRYSSGSFSADIEFDGDGFVTRYPALAERIG